VGRKDYEETAKEKRGMEKRPTLREVDEMGNITSGIHFLKGKAS